MLVLAIICVLYWCLDKKLAYKIALSFFAAGMLLQNLKITFRIPRPWVLDPDFQAVPSAVPAATGYSFPSGHTQSATSLFMTLALSLKQKSLKIICVVIFLLVGFSRMYLGVHTPKDVLTAMAMAIIISLLINKLFDKLENTPKSNLILSIILAGFSVLSMIYALVLLNNGTINEIYAADCCKAAGSGLGFAIGWYLERTYINFETNTAVSKQAAKFILGIASSLLLKGVLKALLGGSIPAEMLQYFILVLWVIAAYPFIFQRVRFLGGEK
ncbi:MAG: hypothetical protein RHS_4216 [Robinsoniella sp. RHS]|nr:MAG: hypothetical protein RHS_4216 [Robinsoniella sp. RHS]